MTDRLATYIPFMKMHGLGNDFVVVDERGIAPMVTKPVAISMADRHRGIGFDQLAVISNSADDKAIAHLTFWNSDGSLSAACGNATRCIAQFLMNETQCSSVSVTTDHGVLKAVQQGGVMHVNMGVPRFEASDIPLSEQIDTLFLPLDGTPTATNMGNPHCTFFVGDVAQIDLETLGAEIETHRFFPERTNVQFAQVVGPDHLRMRVWERGAGVTLASGSSSCATVVAAARRGLTSKAARVDLDGGTLFIDWRDDGVWMAGPTAHVFDGRWFTQ